MDAPGPGGSRKRKQAVRNDHVIDLTGEDDDSSSPGLPHDGSAGPSRGKARSKSSARPAAKERRVDAEGKTVRYSAAPSQKVLERMERALPGSSHRMFMIESRQLSPPGSAGGRKHEFKVLGATGNVYDVTICRQPHCSCPDHEKGNLCKHILFVMLRVLKLPRTEPIVWQRALLEVEVEQALAELAGGRAGADVVASAAVRATYQQLTAGGAGGSGSGGGVAAAAASVRRAIEGDCPVCCEELEPAGEALVFCGSCGNNIHRLCFDKWAAQGRRQGGGSGVTCVMCRAPWVDGASGKAAADSGSAGAVAAVAAVPGLGPGGYLNLAAVSDAHRGAQAASLEALYGDRSVWIQANQGRIGRREAASLWAASGHY